MMTSSPSSILRSATVAALLATSACSSDTAGTGGNPSDGHAYLTIVGDRNVFVDGGSSATLTVKYHDEGGAPLAGTVQFRIEGAPNGSNISKASGVTNGDGIVKVDVVGNAAGEASFNVVAEAEYATPVDWRVAVSSGEPPLPPISAVGSYELESQFDMVSGLPGTVGDVVTAIIELTDDPNDPATWLIDFALDSISSSTIRDLVDSLRPGLDAFVNGLILDYAPDFVTAFVNLGDAFGQIAHRLGTVSDLRVLADSGPDGELTADHKLTGIRYTVDGVDYDYTLAELDLGVVQAQGLSCLVDSNRLYIGDHELPFAYGRILLFGLNHVIIPAIDPWSDTLGELFISFVDCYSLSWDMADYVGIGSPGLYEAACETALTAAAAVIEDQIAALDATGASLQIHGDARIEDTNHDQKVDKLSGGHWEGEMSFGSVSSTLSGPDQKFIGARKSVD